MITDTTFFTNEPCYTLLDRFKKTLKHVKCFDVLVGISAPADFINYVNPLNLSKREKQSAKCEV